MSDYASGTVAVATVRGVENVRLFRYGGTWISSVLVEDYWWHDAEQIADIRPLIVLDPDDAPLHLADTLIILRRTESRTMNWIADQIEAQTKPPKPAEPTGLGAVVEDAHGTRWTRVELGDAVTRNPWYPADDLDLQPDEYGCIDAVRVLSDGVQS